MNKIVLCIILLFLLINLHDLRDWYYSAIGDEYAYFNYAKSIATGESLPNIFSQRGVYYVIPTLSSYYQAVIMKIIGINVFGWKASQVLLISTTIFGLYLLTKKLFNEKVALLSTWFYSSNHLIWAYVHTGYSNIEALFPYIFSLVALVYKKFFLSGFLAALGFYTFYTSRVTIFVIIALLLLNRKNLRILQAFRNVLFGFALLMIPFTITNKDFLIQDMLARSIVAQNDPLSYVPWYKFVFDNVLRNTAAPFYNNHTGPYISGSILDYLTGALLVIGVIQLVRKHSNTALKLSLLTIYFIPFIAVAVFSPYGHTVISRLHMLIPAYTILAAYGALEVSRFINNRRIKILGIFLVCVLVLLFNMYRFFIKTPTVLASTTEALTVKALIEPCKNTLHPAIIGNIKPLLIPALDAYRLRPQLVDDKEQTKFQLQTSDCLILMQPDDSQLDYYNKQAKELKYQYKEVTDRTGNRKVIILKK